MAFASPRAAMLCPFFFFQAEDGIRDHCVTGVQTCALPGEYVTPGTQVGLLVPLPNIWVVANFREIQIAAMRPGQAASVTVDSVPGQTFRGRSEERRVGKE